MTLADDPKLNVHLRTGYSAGHATRLVQGTYITTNVRM
jgi:hypothetical protein